MGRTAGIPTPVGRRRQRRSARGLPAQGQICLMEPWAKCRHRIALEADFGGAVHLQGDVVFVKFDHFAHHAAGGDHFVALLQRFHHRLFLGALLLRTDEQEIEDNEDTDHRQQREKFVTGCAAGCLRVCSANHGETLDKSKS